jgi:hypothetical protein
MPQDRRGNSCRLVPRSGCEPRLRGANGPVYAGRTAPSTRGERPRLRGANGPDPHGRTAPTRRGE